MDQAILAIIMNLMINNPGISLDTIVTHPSLISYMKEKCVTNNPNYEIIKPYCTGVPE